jgi:hypothetical protein
MIRAGTAVENDKRINSRRTVSHPVKRNASGVGKSGLAWRRNLSRRRENQRRRERREGRTTSNWGTTRISTTQCVVAVVVYPQKKKYLQSRSVGNGAGRGERGGLQVIWEQHSLRPSPCAVAVVVYPKKKNIYNPDLSVT